MKQTLRMTAAVIGRAIIFLVLVSVTGLPQTRVSRDLPSSSAQFPLQGQLAVAEVYSTPNLQVPAATGAIGPFESAANPAISEGDWIALRSPVLGDSSQTGTATRRGGYSPRGRNHWKGRTTRRRPLSHLELRLPKDGAANWVYPIEERHIAGSPFGNREHPLTGERSGHSGQDIGCRRGTPIFAAVAGVVTQSRNSKTAGRYVELDHGDLSGANVKTRYLHLTRRLVQKGARVQMGQQIGTCGSTGASTGPHLHFELRLDDQPTAPFFVSKHVLIGEEAEKRTWDEALALAVEFGTLDQLIEENSVPHEVKRIVREYKRKRGKRPIGRLSDKSEQVSNVSALKTHDSGEDSGALSGEEEAHTADGPVEILVDGAAEVGGDGPAEPSNTAQGDPVANADKPSQGGKTALSAVQPILGLGGPEADTEVSTSASVPAPAAESATSEATKD